MLAEVSFNMGNAIHEELLGNVLVYFIIKLHFLIKNHHNFVISAFDVIF